jgi:peptidoglycan/xylan/chitin deacetylase (PgdA/CDA1 family)
VRSVSGTPILYYHSVAESGLSVKPSIFAAQMSYLKEHGFRAISMKEWRMLVESGQAQAKRVVLTFDDGFGSMWGNVFPLLQEFGFHGTFFVVRSYVGQTLWGDPVTKRWSSEEGPGRIPFPMMNWDQIARMSEAGMEIGSHTLTHPNLNELGDEDARREVFGSKAYLEERLGVPVRGFCYPRGRFTEALARFVREAGYDYACTTEPGHATAESHRFLLPRIPGPASVSDLVFRLNRIPRNILTSSALRVARYAETLRMQLRSNA